MKKISFTALLFFAIILGSCTYRHTTTGGMPPGQAKKEAGSKSAKPYAPGQQEKH